MEGKGIKVFGVVMALLLVFSLAATLSVSNTVSAGTQKWTKISIPGTDDMQLAPGTDVGAIAVSPDGATLFAAVIIQSTDTWNVYKSTDGGYTWKVTGWNSPATDANDIVAIKISPDWDDDDTLVVATAGNVSYSEDGGKTFDDMGAGALGTITCLDIALDEDGDLIYAVGTSGASGEVYILSGFGGWVAQKIENPDSAALSAYNFTGGVLAVAFSPNFGEDDTVFAIVSGNAPLEAPGTHLRAESDTTVHNWGSFIQDAHFIDPTTSPTSNVIATSASMAFADDFNSVPAIFVGLIAGTSPNQKGDAFRVDVVKGSIGTSAVQDLDIRGLNTKTNVKSIDVSGDASSAFILAGLWDLSNTGPMSSWQGQVHYSANGGETWLQSYKPPSGMWTSPQTTAPTVLMAPDFAESGIAYCANGYMNHTFDVAFSGFYVSTTQGTTWNGRGLIDHTINTALQDCIEDIVPSPDYDSDSTLFMVTRDANFAGAGKNYGLLWETKDGGSKWELILGMTLSIPVPGVIIDKIAIPATYPGEPEIFVTGPVDGQGGFTALIARSTDEGNLFATTLKAPYDGAIPQIVDSWIVFDQNTLIVANGSNIWKTTDMGAHWKLPTMADIDTSANEKVIDMQQYKDTNTLLAGTNLGNMFICQDWQADFSFTEVGQSPCSDGDLAYVAFDANFDENGFVYAGVTSTTAANRGIWRADVNSDDTWDQIDNNLTSPACGNVSSIACDGNGILWALCSGSTVIRSVNPNEPLYDEVLFEQEITGLGSSVIFKDLETAPTQTYVFAIGGNASYPTELWAYIDTLIKPTLISPACGSTATGTIIQGTSTARVSLMWEDMPKSTEYEYEVAYDNGFGSIAASGNLSGTQVSVNLYLGEKYYWRVRASQPVVSQWSEICNFTTPLGPASAKPIITYPGSQDSHNEIKCPLTLTWTSTVEATGFELVLAENCDWANPVIDMTGSNVLGTDTCYTLPDCNVLKEGASYCWKVRAVNGDTDTMSPWSDTGTFTTFVSPAVEEEGTPMWVWVVIALSAVLLVGVVVLIIRTRRPV
jgi:photosystem II stability/assembly factor-like uncharacterized protein